MYSNHTKSRIKSGVSGISQGGKSVQNLPRPNLSKNVPVNFQKRKKSWKQGLRNLEVTEHYSVDQFKDHYVP